jgi:hypothetical protein
LYLQNPLGKFVGFDGVIDGRVVAHYACIPSYVEGFSQKCLLSLNTATHPDYQGLGLFKLIAQQTYDTYIQEFSCVIGVANSKSEKTFVQKLGFLKLGNLDLRYGKLNRKLQGARLYSKEDIEWRARCPKRELILKEVGPMRLLFLTHRLKGAFRLKSIVHVTPSWVSNQAETAARFGFTLDWRKGHKPLLCLPSRFKPSPLSLIYKPMSENKPTVLSSFSFPDFDAF